jgi:hypothetical protein
LNAISTLFAQFGQFADSVRVDDEGEPHRLTLGSAIKASTSTGEAKAAFFVTTLEVGDELPLHDPARRPSAERARGRGWLTGAISTGPA